MLETEFIDAEVTKIEEITDTEGKKAYRIILNAGESVEAKTIIAATGASHRKLGAAGEEEFTGTVKKNLLEKVFHIVQLAMVHFLRKR